MTIEGEEGVWLDTGDLGFIHVSLTEKYYY